MMHVGADVARLHRVVGAQHVLGRVVDLQVADGHVVDEAQVGAAGGVLVVALQVVVDPLRRPRHLPELHDVGLVHPGVDEGGVDVGVDPPAPQPPIEGAVVLLVHRPLGQQRRGHRVHACLLGVLPRASDPHRRGRGRGGCRPIRPPTPSAARRGRRSPAPAPAPGSGTASRTPARRGRRGRSGRPGRPRTGPGRPAPWPPPPPRSPARGTRDRPPAARTGSGRRTSAARPGSTGPAAAPRGRRPAPGARRPGRSASSGSGSAAHHGVVDEVLHDEAGRGVVAEHEQAVLGVGREGEPEAVEHVQQRRQGGLVQPPTHSATVRPAAGHDRRRGRRRRRGRGGGGRPVVTARSPGARWASTDSRQIAPSISVCW